MITLSLILSALALGAFACGSLLMIGLRLATIGAKIGQPVAETEVAGLLQLRRQLLAWVAVAVVCLLLSLYSVACAVGVNQ